MKIKTLLLVVLILPMLFACKCGDNTSSLVKEENKRKSIDACIAQGGIPILDGWGDMTDCKFPPHPVEKK